MSDTLEKVRSYISRHSMLEGARGLIVAVSGGPDSVALLDLLVRLAEADDKSEIRLHVAHLNHQLRGRESDQDADFVCALADGLKLSCTVVSRDVRAMARRRGIEETAREIRYSFLVGVARRLGFDRIATGHTMTDQAETLLMRLVRGSGLRGLSAMRAVSDAPRFPHAEPQSRREENRIDSDKSDFFDAQAHLFTSSPLHLFTDSPVLLIRPMLSVTREEVEEYCLERKIDYRTDSSNLEMKYARNRVRHRVLPAMRELNPRAVDAIARAAEIVASEQDALSSVVVSLMRDALIEKESSDKRAAYSIPGLLVQPAALRRRMIIEALRNTGAGDKREAREGEIEMRHIAEVERLTQGRSGSRVMLPGGLEVWREFDRLLFLRRAPEIESYEFEINTSSPGEAGGFRIELARGRPASELNELMEEAKTRRKESGRDWMMAVLDDERLDENLRVRVRREGERAAVLGHSKTKKLKKLMIGHRIAPSRRNTWPVVATSDGRYVWSPALPPASIFAPHNQSRRLAIMRATEI